MSQVTLSATPKGNGFQATVSFDGFVTISSAETYPSISEAITAAAVKLLDMPERVAALDPDHPLSFEQFQRNGPSQPASVVDPIGEG
ncbi:MAG: hypothetical protein V4472_10140 [Pseudomonadota bacterium]